ncbi:MAG: hypothetical protein ACK51N_05765 [bacterium]|jgi:hypothetical protein|nr:hypothetical protein [Phycisphaerales bacterium]MCE2654589.1 hypothetical protein [Planctomycetaceae bacterium]
MKLTDVRIPVDLANPGQFFSCCGLFELAARLWPGSVGFFGGDCFVMQVSRQEAGLQTLLRVFKDAPLLGDSDASEEDGDDAGGGEGEEEDSGLATPMMLGEPFDLRLDWWADKALKPWAGTMNAKVIFESMRAAVDPVQVDPFGDLRVVYAPPDPTKPKAKAKKREPFYFDARRGGSAKSIDLGFAPDAIQMPSAACPAVEALTLVGLQRFRPMPTDRPRTFEYRAWATPLPLTVAALAACCRLHGVVGPRFRFENGFRTDQRKHKGFLPAVRLNEGDAQ